MVTMTIKGVNKMARGIKARFTKGKIEPLERLDLREGAEITITIREEAKSGSDREALARTAGAWKDTLDFDAYLKDLYASRRQPSRNISL